MGICGAKPTWEYPDLGPQSDVIKVCKGEGSGVFARIPSCARIVSANWGPEKNFRKWKNITEQVVKGHLLQMLRPRGGKKKANMGDYVLWANTEKWGTVAFGTRHQLTIEYTIPSGLVILEAEVHKHEYVAKFGDKLQLPRGCWVLSATYGLSSKNAKNYAKKKDQAIKAMSDSRDGSILVCKKYFGDPWYGQEKTLIVETSEAIKVCAAGFQAVSIAYNNGVTLVYPPLPVVTSTNFPEDPVKVDARYRSLGGMEGVTLGPAITAKCAGEAGQFLRIPPGAVIGSGAWRPVTEGTRSSVVGAGDITDKLIKRHLADSIKGTDFIVHATEEWWGNPWHGKFKELTITYSIPNFLTVPDPNPKNKIFAMVNDPKGDRVRDPSPVLRIPKGHLILKAEYGNAAEDRTYYTIKTKEALAAYVESRDGSFPVDKATFGDPWPGKAKKLYVETSAPLEVYANGLQAVTIQRKNQTGDFDRMTYKSITTRVLEQQVSLRQQLAIAIKTNNFAEAHRLQSLVVTGAAGGTKVAMVTAQVVLVAAGATKVSGAAAPVMGVPVMATPVQGIPVQAVPVMATPVQGVPVQAVPVMATPVQGVPVQAVPVMATPVQGVPVQAVPVMATPVQGVPVQATPVQAIPVQAVPVAASAPVQATPVQAVPVVVSAPVQAVPVAAPAPVQATVPVQATPVPVAASAPPMPAAVDASTEKKGFQM